MKSPQSVAIGGLVTCVKVVCAGLAEVVRWRAFPAGGRYPFSLAEAAAGVVFCGLGLAFTWRVDGLRILHERNR